MFPIAARACPTVGKARPQPRTLGQPLYKCQKRASAELFGIYPISSKDITQIISFLLNALCQ